MLIQRCYMYLWCACTLIPMDLAFVPMSAPLETPQSSRHHFHVLLHVAPPRKVVAASRASTAVRSPPQVTTDDLSGSAKAVAGGARRSSDRPLGVISSVTTNVGAASGMSCCCASCRLGRASAHIACTCSTRVPDDCRLILSAPSLVDGNQRRR